MYKQSEVQQIYVCDFLSSESIWNTNVSNLYELFEEIVDREIVSGKLLIINVILEYNLVECFRVVLFVNFYT